MIVKFPDIKYSKTQKRVDATAHVSGKYFGIRLLSRFTISKWERYFQELFDNMSKWKKSEKREGSFSYYFQDGVSAFIYDPKNPPYKKRKIKAEPIQSTADE